MTRGAGGIAAIFAVALGVAVELSVGAVQPLRVAAGDLLAGLALGGAGAAAIARAPRRWAGWWLVVAAVLWFAATLAADRHAMLRDIGEQAGLAYRGALITAVVLVCCHRHAALALVAAAAAWVDGLIPAVGRSAGASFALAALVLVAALADKRRAPIGWRILPAVCLAAALAGPAAVTELGQAADTGNRVLLAADLAIGLTAVLTAALWIEVRTTDQILELAGDGNLDQALGFALVDPDVRVLAPVVGTDARVGRERTAVRGAGGEAIAVLEHAPGALAEPGLRAAVTTAIVLHYEHRRRRTELSTAAAEVRESQRRMVVAADDARARLRRRLEHGALPQALAIRDRLARSESTAAAAAGLTRAIEELRALALGLHPRALAPSGLAGALSQLGRAAPVSVAVEVDGRRFADDVELVVYFACAEALTNAIKHASAASIAVTVAATDGRLVAKVSDDGVGGAQLSPDSGMVIRVAAVGGQVEVDSPAGVGTTVRVEVPL
jgi:signal transduction histidine kinase